MKQLFLGRSEKALVSARTKVHKFAKIKYRWQSIKGNLFLVLHPLWLLLAQRNQAVLHRRNKLEIKINNVTILSMKFSMNLQSPRE